VWNDHIAEFARAALTLSSRDIAIVPADDPRVVDFAGRYPVTKTLLSSFTDLYGRPAPPAALIVRQGAPVRRLDAIAAFRNAVALVFALRARAGILSHKGWGASAAWTDKFDFHAAEVDKKGNIQIHSAALLHWAGQPKKLCFASSALIDRDIDIRFVDDPLAALLGRAWKDLFVRGRRAGLLRPVFRSLELAYQAGAVPWKNAGSIHDFGLTVAHWVSALETLLWPLNSRASQTLSLQYCTGFGRTDSRLRHRRFRLKRKAKPPKKWDTVSADASQKLCALMYAARNAFLHGERFATSHLSPKGKWPHLKVHHGAAVLYRYALIKRLLDIYPPAPLPPDELPPFLIAHWITEDAYESALLDAFK
jgi:hypothetical protein